MILLLFIILILLSALFSSTEIAFFSLGQAKAKTLVEKNKPNAQLIWDLKHQPQKLLITILIGNNIVNVLTASLATVLTTQYFGSAGVGIATGVVTIIILVFGEITPKSIAQKNNVLIAQKTAKFLWFLNIVLSPISWLLMKWNDAIIKRFVKSGEVSISEQEIRALTRLGVEKGAIDYQEREMIERIFNFDDITVKEIMTPRYKMVSLNGDVGVDNIAHFISESGFSRYPVFENEEDKIIGYVHINDVMRILNSNHREQPIKTIVRPIMKIHDTHSIEQLFRRMLKKQEHIALVLNEEPTVVGIATLENILEQLVGDIQDETDKRHHKRKRYNS